MLFVNSKNLGQSDRLSSLCTETGLTDMLKEVDYDSVKVMVSVTGAIVKEFGLLIWLRILQRFVQHRWT